MTGWTGRWDRHSHSLSCSTRFDRSSAGPSPATPARHHGKAGPPPGRDRSRTGRKKELTPLTPAYDGRHAPAAPVAQVNLRDPGSGTAIADVPMLIDSGSDVTLLPESAVASLGLRGTGERYRLEAFDGTITESEAVRASFVFLDKTFTGRFLVVESEVGVIGRNVLNCVRLLLDGPALNWEELPSTA